MITSWNVAPALSAVFSLRPNPRNSSVDAIDDPGGGTNWYRGALVQMVPQGVVYEEVAGVGV